MSFARYRGRYLQPHHWAIASASANVVTAGRTFLLMVDVPAFCTVDAVVVLNAGTAAGNITVGLYGPVTGDTCLDAVLLGESASTAASGTNSPQVITFATPITIQAGKYYIAVEHEDATTPHTYMRQANQNQATGQHQFYDRGGGYGALTNPCPAVTNTGSNAPAAQLRVSG